MSSPGEMDVKPAIANEEQLRPDPLNESDLPLSIQETLSSRWAADQRMWNNEGFSKSSGFYQYPLSWWESGLGNDRQSRKKRGDIPW